MLVPWLAVDAAATLTVDGEPRPVARLLDDLDAAERDGVRRTDLVLDDLMGPTRKRDLRRRRRRRCGRRLRRRSIGLYGWFPPITVWTGLSLLVVAAAEAGWAFYVRSKIADGRDRRLRRAGCIRWRSRAR